MTEHSKIMGTITRIVFLFMLFFYGAEGLAFEQNGMEINGFVTQGYLKSNENDFIAETKDGSFQFNEMGLNFNKKLADGLDASLQFFAYDFGSLGNDEISISHACVSAYYSNWLTFRAGKSRASFGLYGNGRDVDMLRAFVLLPQGVYTEAFRETINSGKGIEIYGSGYPDPLKFASPIGDFYYHLQYGIVDTPEDSGLSRVISMTMHTRAEESSSKESVNLIVGWESPVPGLRIQGQYSKFDFRLAGTTFDDKFWDNVKGNAIDYLFKRYTQEQRDAVDRIVTVGNMPTLYSGDVTVYVYGAEYTWNELVLAAESVMYVEEFDVDVNFLLAGDPYMYQYPFKNDTLGYYGMLSYRVTEWLRMGGYYSVYYPNKDNKKGGSGTNLGPPDYFAWQKDSCIAAQFDLNVNSIFKIEAHYMDGGAQLDYMNQLDDYSKINRYWYLFAAKLSFNF